MSKVTKSDILRQIGLSVVTIGLGIGSGEFILWPYLSYSYGFGILWGALFGITLQIILNIQIQRYALVSNQSLVTGAYKLSKYYGLWFIVSTILGFGWPGFAASSAYLIQQIFSTSDNVLPWLSFLVLVIAGLILILGKDVYHRIEKLLKVIVPTSFVIILIIFISFFDWEMFKLLILGMFGLESGYRLFPPGLSLSLFLGAIVYAGSGGNLLLSQASYVLEKKKFSQDLRENHKFVIFENIFVFGGLGLLTILMLSYLSRVLTLPISSIINDLSFLPIQAWFIGEKLGDIFRILFLLSGAFALFSVQLGVLDLLGRISNEIFGLRFGKKSHQIYSLAVIIQVLIGSIILLSGTAQPLWLIITGSIFNALAMGVISFITLILLRKVKKEYQPNIFTQILLGSISIFYIAFFVVTVISSI